LMLFCITPCLNLSGRFLSEIEGRFMGRHAVQTGLLTK
jgi:hypothetical protein